MVSLKVVKIKKKILVILGIITTIILYSLSLTIKTDTTQFNNFQNNNFPVGKTFNPLLEKSLSYDLVPLEPIEIISDDNFTDYGFDGTGADSDPYIIEGYNITATSGHGISIKSTTKYFVIRNCFIDAERYGIHIAFATEGSATIINNTCTNNDQGIHLDSSSGSVLTNNTCINNVHGISLDSSSGSVLTNNTCINNFNGIMQYSSSDSTLTNNNCTNNNYYGIELVDSSGSVLSNNTCTNNYYGLYIAISDSCFITYNFLQENEKYGINILPTSYYSNIIHHNTFVDNNLEGSSQARDDGKKNIWYEEATKEGNYWNNLGSKSVYKIEGKAHSRDKYPLNREETCPNPNTMTSLSIILPVIISGVLLAFLLPRYILPYTRNHVLPFVRKRREKKEKVKKTKTQIVFIALIIASLGITIWIFLSIIINLYWGIDFWKLIVGIFSFGFLVFFVTLYRITVKYRITVNLEDYSRLDENQKRIKKISIFNLIQLVLSIIFIGFGAFGYAWVHGETVAITLFSLMFLGLLLIILSRILIEKTNPNQSESKIKTMLIISVTTGIIGFLLVVGSFIGLMRMASSWSFSIGL